ncbi:MAG: hypothetical protein R2815_01115 [Flavobacteriales bacterium]
MRGHDEDQDTRPTGAGALRSFCRLSAVNIILSGIFYLIGTVAFIGIAQVPYDEFNAVMQARLTAIGGADEVPGMEALVQLMYDRGAWLMLILLVRTIVRGLGVLLMWRWRAAGFSVYAFAQIAGIFAPHLVLPWAYLGIFGPVAAIGMTALYGTQRQWLR